MEHGHRPWFTLSTPSISHAPGATAGLSKGTTLVWVIERPFSSLSPNHWDDRSEGVMFDQQVFISFLRLSTFFGCKLRFPSPPFFFVKLNLLFICFIILLKWRSYYLTDCFSQKRTSLSILYLPLIPPGLWNWSEWIFKKMRSSLLLWNHVSFKLVWLKLSELATALRRW